MYASTDIDMYRACVKADGDSLEPHRRDPDAAHASCRARRTPNRKEFIVATNHRF
jgi:hypothetical protein